MREYEKDLEEYLSEFYSHECDCIERENFLYNRTVASGEVWYCKEHHCEIMTREEPNPDDY